MTYQPQLRQASTQRFDVLNGALPTNVAPTDIDQALERRGHFLFLEFKRPHQSVPRGQARLFESLVQLGSHEHDVRLLHVLGHPPDAIEAYGWWGERLQPRTSDDLRRFVRRWWDWAGKR